MYTYIHENGYTYLDVKTYTFTDTCCEESSAS